MSARFSADSPLLSEEIRPSVSKFMAYAHSSANDLSKKYLAQERRFNYTTPKTFLELISLYLSMLEEKHVDLTGRIERLENGIGNGKAF